MAWRVGRLWRFVLWAVGCVVLLCALAIAGFLSQPYLPQSSTEIPRGYADPSLLPGGTRAITGRVAGATESDYTDAPFILLTVAGSTGESQTVVLNSYTSLDLADGQEGKADSPNLTYSVLSLIGENVAVSARPKLPWMPGESHEFYAFSARFFKP